MDELSYKAKVIIVALNQMKATNKDNKTNSYAILDYIVEETDALCKDPMLKDIPEEDLVNITIDISIKSINTLITSLAKKNIVEKTEPTSILVEGTRRNLRQYYLKK